VRTTYRVLIVEDDAMIRDSLLEVFDEHGYETVGAIHGGDALIKLRDPSRPTGLILLDLMMPVMDGTMFREQQLADPTLASIPVIVLSAHSDVAARAKTLHIADFLPKPINLARLMDMVARHCPIERAT
jgi:CheY-like chemotaxis protein